MANNLISIAKIHLNFITYLCFSSSSQRSKFLTGKWRFCVLQISQIWASIKITIKSGIHTHTLNPLSNLQPPKCVQSPTKVTIDYWPNCFVKRYLELAIVAFGRHIYLNEWAPGSLSIAFISATLASFLR